MSWAALQLTVVVALVAASAETQTSALQRRFNQFDRNGDGKITAEELGMPTVFKAADGNGDGTIFPD